MFKRFRPPADATIPFLVLISFLIWFLVSRLFVYAFPLTHVTIQGMHIHHYAFGIILLSIFAFVFLAYPTSQRTRMQLAIPLGIALAFAYDEYSMWFTFGGTYYDHRTYDAVLTVVLILLNLTYFPHFWARWGRRLEKLVNIILFGLPRLLYRRLRNKKRK